MRNINILLNVIVICFFSFFVCQINAEEIRDYYSETGLHPFKNPTSDLNETIDPFSGTMQLRHTDITVPGNGGMDISVTRFYTNHQDFGNRQPGYQSLYGTGWTMHFGRIVVPQLHVGKICTQATFSVTTADNPSIEYPDGARELLVLATDGSGDLITKGNWRARCISGQDGMLVISPDGTEYTMNVRATVSTGENSLETSWYTSLQKDVYGNAIQITYTTNPLGYMYIDEVIGGRINNTNFTSDGRLVKFNYTTESNSCFLLDNITSDNRTWAYNYDSALSDPDPNFNLCRYNLTEVTLPSNQRWQYEYYPDTHPGAGKYSISKVTYPYGGMYEYTYQHIQFDVTMPNQTTGILTKSVSGPNITPGTWSYNFAPGSRTITGDNGGSIQADVTTVTQPNGTTIHVHQGAASIGFNNVWATGLLLGQEVYTPGGVLIEQTTSVWDKRLISNENYFHGIQGQVDTETHAPIAVATHTWRNGNTHSTLMSNHDVYGNPGTVEETTIIGGQPSKITNYTYFNDPALWIIGKTEDETITGIGTIDRTYNSIGQVISEDKYGVVTTFTYTTDGDVNTITDARSNTMTKSDYFRGIPRLENHPEGVNIQRTVNTTGTVASLTNGRGFTKNFTYDGLNRLTGIDFPLNADVTVNWTATGKELIRDNYTETVTFDGFGKEYQIIRLDTDSAESISKNTNYDALGQKIFESYPNSTDGITFSYDVLGRLTRLEHPDGAFRTYDFGAGGIVVTETDERSNQTQYIYRSHGHPDNGKVPMFINSPESICTQMQYNLLNQVTQVFQGETDPNDGTCFGFARQFVYNTKYFLESEQNPETGITTYGRDEIGNMISRQVGTSGVTSFIYDGRNRLTFTDYPSTTPDVTRVYDDNDNIREVNNSDSMHEYVYDDNDNLQSEIIDIDNNQYSINYTYDNKDIIKTLSYPSGRVIDYDADAFGRPTKITPYVNSINYYPSGQIQQMAYANGQTTEVTLTDRLWIDRIHAFGITEAADLTYDYDVIGNIETITDAIDSLNNKTLAYDNMNRLISANGPWGTGIFDYDALGNLLTMNISGQLQSYNYSSQRLTRVGVSSSSQHLYSYDEYGNIDFDALTNSFGQIFSENQYDYDDAGNLRTAIRSQGPGVPIHNFAYDGNGMRVGKTTNIEDIKYVYAKNGNLLGEYKPAQGIQFGKEYVYLGSQLVASPQENIPPTANAGDDFNALGGTSVILNASTSNDADGNIVTYNWQQLSGISVTINNSNNAEADFLAPVVVSDEILSFEVTVTDNDGSNSTDTITVTIFSNVAPTINITEPTDNLTFVQGALITFNGTAADNEDGDISSNIVWSSDIDGEIGTGSSVSSNSLSANNTHTITANITDSGNKVSTSSITITIEADSDGDGIIDSVEISLGLNPNDASDAAGDLDNDGFSNLQEVLTGNDANDALSKPTRGTEAWSFITNGPIESTPAIASDGTLYFGSNDNNVYALRPDGTLKWIFETGGDVRSSPAVATDGTIYVGSFDGNLYAINPDGTLKWSNAIGSSFSASPAIAENGRIYVYGANRLRAFEPDGDQRWSRQINFNSNSTLDSSPAIGVNGQIYIGTDSKVFQGTDSSGAVSSINSNSGTFEWSVSIGGADVIASPAISADGKIYIGSSLTLLRAFNLNGEEEWSIDLGSSIYGSPVIGVNNNVYIATRNGQLHAVDSNGTLLWSYATGGFTDSSPAIAADGTIYIPSSDNNIHAVDPTGNLIWIYATDDSIDGSSPVIGLDGTIYVGSDDNKLYALVDNTGGVANSVWPLFRHDTEHSGNIINTDGIFPPAVIISSTDSEWELGQTVTISATALDIVDGNLNASIQWTSSLDGALGTGSTINTILSLGSHEITASVTNSNTLTTTDVFNLSVVSFPPELTINSPSQGAIFTTEDSITFSGIAIDDVDGDISNNIQWTSQIDGTIGIGASITSTLSEGEHDITAIISDSEGQIETQGIGITVEPTTNQPPTVTIFGPPDGSTFPEGSDVLIVAEANDAEDEIFELTIEWESDIDGILQSTELEDTFELSVGAHLVTVTVTDSSNQSASATVGIIITPTTSNTVPEVVNPIPDQSVNIGDLYSYTIPSDTFIDNDPGDELQLGARTPSGRLPDWLAFNAIGEDATLSGTPSEIDAETVEIIIRATDSGGLFVEDTYTLTVNALTSLNVTSPLDGGEFTTNDTITFSGSSLDPEDGDISSNIVWASDIDGSLGIGGTITASLSQGMHEITASSTDGNNATVTEVIEIEVLPQNNQTPIVTITAPANGAAFLEIDTINLVALAADSEDGDLSGAITWTSDLDGSLGIGGNINTTLSIGLHEITASATDSNNATGSNTINISISPATNTPPTISINTPSDGATFIELDNIEFSAVASDTEDGDLSNNIQWLSDIDGELGNGGTINTTLTVGTHQVTAIIVDSDNVSVSEIITITVNPLGDTVTDAALTTDIESPQTDGASVILTAQATGGNGNVEYQFRVKGPSTSNQWVILQDYSSVASIVWDTTGALGKNRLQVKARNAGTQDTPAKDTITFWVNDVNPTTEVTLTTNETSPATIGTVVTLTGQGIGGTGSYEYQFRVKGPATDDAWQILQDFSISNTTTWDTTTYPGKNRIQVRARNLGSTDRWVKDTQTFWVNSLSPTTGVSVIFENESPQPEGLAISLAGQGEGGTGSYEYQFRVKGPATNNIWIILQDFSSTVAYTWNSAGFAGTNKIQVRARTAGTNDKPVKKNTNYVITGSGGN